MRLRTRLALVLAGLAALLGIGLAAPAAQAAPAKPAAPAIAATTYDYTLCRNVVPPGDASGEYASLCVRWVDWATSGPVYMNPYTCTITNHANHTIVVGTTGTLTHRYPDHANTLTVAADPFGSGPTSILPGAQAIGACWLANPRTSSYYDANPVTNELYPDGQLVLSLPMARSGYSYTSFTNTDTNP